MNYRVLSIAAVVAFGLAGCQTTGRPIDLGTVNKVVASGTSQTIGFASAVRRDCTPYGEMVVRVLEAPSHGKVTIKSAQEYPSLSPFQPAAACNARRVRGKLVTYTPDRNYIGPDAARLQIITPIGVEITNGYVFTVK